MVEKCLGIQFECSLQFCALVNLIRIACNWFTLLRFAMACLELKRNYVTFMVHLQEHSKTFCYIMVYGELGGGGKVNNLLCILIVLHDLKHARRWLLSNVLCTYNMCIQGSYSFCMKKKSPVSFLMYFTEYTIFPC